jgi:hypothetical protein
LPWAVIAIVDAKPTQTRIGGVGRGVINALTQIAALAVAARRALRFCAQTMDQRLESLQIQQDRYVTLNISLIPLAEIGINASLAADVDR